MKAITIREELLVGDIEGQARAWLAVHRLCCDLGMGHRYATAKEEVLRFIFRLHKAADRKGKGKRK